MEAGEARRQVAMALSLVARREGRNALPQATWAQLMSLSLGWMPPAKARSFVARALASGLLQARGEMLEFVGQAEEAPLGFRPDPDLDPGPAPAGGADDGGFLGWVDRVAQRTGVPRAHVLADVAALQHRMGGWLDADVAALWLARDSGLEVKAAAQARLEALAAPATPSSAGAPRSP